ncbi:hypothetical protein ACHWQZ_G004519 [Mnemiopsis leidyi]
MKDRIKVIARFRPGVTSNIYDVREGSVFVDGKPYTYDSVLHGQCSQELVYSSTAKPVVQELLKGYNATIFVYGQTSSGKTYTMEGDGSGRRRGIIPRVVEDIFSHISKMEDNIEFTINIAYYEIYMEKIRDLLDTNKKNLSIHEDKAKITYVKNVTERYVDTSAQILQLLEEGKRNRSVAVTDMNEHSSRSHSVFQITVNQCNLTTQQKLSSKLYLVDLAGSEKTSKTNAQGMTLDEAKKINTSLMCLGKVISALSEGQGHIPYRESKLTRVLQHSLGGNSRTTIIICMSMDANNESETKSTLAFGTRAKKIKNVVTPNIELSHEELKKRYDRMKHMYEKCNTELRRWRRGESVSEEDQVELMADLSTLLTSSSTCTCTNVPAVVPACTCTKSVPVIRAGTQHRAPCLVNLNEDPREGEYLSVDIPEGMLVVGSSDDSNVVDIHLSDVLIHPIHCKLENRGGRVYLKQWEAEATVFVNGQLLIGEVTLNHGDRVIFGGSHYFRFTAPGGTVVLPDNKLRNVADYEFAKTELINSVNNQKHMKLMSENESLGRELEQARSKIADMFRELEASQAIIEGQTASSSRRRSSRRLSSVTASSSSDGEDCVERLVVLSEQLRNSIMNGRVPKQDKNLQISTYLDSCDSLLNDETFNMYLKMKEASELCKLIKRNIVFTCETASMDSRSDVFIRAADLTNNRAIVWSFETFCERVEGLKSYYQSLCLESATPVENKNMSIIFGCEEEWEKDLSILSDEVSVISETKMSSTTSESFLSATSFVSTPRSSKTSNRDQYGDCLSQLQYLLTTSPQPLDTLTGNTLCDTLLESVRIVSNTLSFVADRDMTQIPKLTHHMTCLHRDAVSWTQHTKPNFKLTHAVQDVLSAVKRIVQRRLEGRSVSEADLARTQELLLEVVYNAGHMCGADLVQGTSTAASQSEGKSHGVERSALLLTSTPSKLCTKTSTPKVIDLDVTSDYNSSASSIDTSQGDISGNIRENLLQGVLDYLKQQLDETTEGLSSTLSLSLSSSVRIPSRRLKENVKTISEILATKKEELSGMFSDETTAVQPLLVQVTSPVNLFPKLNEIQSWSRIVTAAVTDKENTPDSSHVIRQLNSKIEEVLRLQVPPV